MGTSHKPLGGHKAMASQDKVWSEGPCKVCGDDRMLYHGYCAHCLPNEYTTPAHARVMVSCVDCGMTIGDSQARYGPQALHKWVVCGDGPRCPLCGTYYIAEVDAGGYARRLEREALERATRLQAILDEYDAWERSERERRRVDAHRALDEMGG